VGGDVRAHFTLPCLYLAQKKIVDRLNIPSIPSLFIIKKINIY
jgi:hypothetical protein